MKFASLAMEENKRNLDAAPIEDLVGEDEGFGDFGELIYKGAKAIGALVVGGFAAAGIYHYGPRIAEYLSK